MTNKYTEGSAWLTRDGRKAVIANQGPGLSTSDTMKVLVEGMPAYYWLNGTRDKTKEEELDLVGPWVDKPEPLVIEVGRSYKLSNGSKWDCLAKANHPSAACSYVGLNTYSNNQYGLTLNHSGYNTQGTVNIVSGWVAPEISGYVNIYTGDGRPFTSYIYNTQKEALSRKDEFENYINTVFIEASSKV
jgi:hypothetical protein